MTLNEFKASLDREQPPAGLGRPLEALWQDGKGRWDAAHAIAQSLDNAAGAWIHAYLHRKEGDAGNAAFWYGCAGRPPCTTSLEEEWEAIAAGLLAAAR